MILPPDVEYLRRQMLHHIAAFFTREALGLVGSNLVRFLPYEEAARSREGTISIPFDIPVPKHPQEPYKVDFNTTTLTLWNRIPCPEIGSWKAIPNESAPLWFQNDSGGLIPAWNLFGNIFHLLIFGEEVDQAKRDRHGRFSAAFSPRSENELLEVPAFNEAVAAIVAACSGLRTHGEPRYELTDQVKPPVVVLSHDCDLLRGNDLWTQAVRGVRIILPLMRARLPHLGNAWWIVRNAATPRRFYFDNATGMIDAERLFGFQSTLYLLNGRGGRFGARSGSAILADLLSAVPPGWDVGIHYNYDTFLDEDRFGEQFRELEEIVGKKISVGRAHYLRIDPQRSFTFLQEHGIEVDESSGYADRIGYRNGLAGCFQVYDAISRKMSGIWEVPLTFMDEVLVRQYRHNAVPVFARHLRHLSRIGGALTLLFHPGQFFNPEHKQMLGVYHRLLMCCRDIGAVSLPARRLIERVLNRFNSSSSEDSR